MASGSFNLSTDGYLQGRIVWSSQSNGVVANSSNVTAYLQIHRTNTATTTGTFNYGFRVGAQTQFSSWYGSINNNWTTIATLNNPSVPHNQDGNGTCFLEAYADGPSGTSLSGKRTSGNSTVQLDKIDRYATITEAPNFNDEENPTIKYSNPAGNNVSTLQVCIANSTGQTIYVPYRDISKTGNSYTFELTSAERELLRNATPNSNTLSVQFIVKTIISGQTFTQNATKTMTIINANPVFSNFEFEDINSTTLALTDDDSINVNGYSTIQATISTLNKATAQKGASMSKYRFVSGTNQPVEEPYSDDSSVVLTMNNAQNGTYQIYAIDSRNNSTLVSKLASKEIAYTPISFITSSCKVERNNGGVGSYAVLTLSGNIWNDYFDESQQNANSITSVSYEYKKTNESTWQTGPTTITPTISNNTFSFTGQVASQEEDYKFDLNKSYDFRITMTDELSTATIQLTPMSSAIPNISFADDGVGIMCDYDETIGGPGQVNNNPIAYYPIGSIYMSVNSTSPETLFGGTWEQLKDRFLLGSGDSYTAGNTGGKKELTLSANIGACSNDAASLGYITETPSSYQQNHNADYVIRGTNVGYSHWNHSTPVTEKDTNSRNTSIMPPYLVVYMWKRVA